MAFPSDPPASRPGGNPTRRNLLTAAGAAGAGALLAVGAAGRAEAVAVAAAGPAASRGSGGEITRVVGRTGERLRAVGLGTFMTFDKRPGAPRGHLREVLKRYWEAGGRVIDTSPLYGGAELSVGDFATDLGIADDIFLTNKSWSTGEYLSDESHMMRQLETSKTRLWRDRMDVLQVHNLVNAEAAVPILRRWKGEGKIRYVGVSHHAPQYYPAIEVLMRNFDVDFVQVRYSIFTRHAEERILPLAADRGIGVMVNMSMEKGRLHKLVEGHRVPGWARSFGADTWAKFFLKYVLSHPAVTVVLQATSDPDHLDENMTVLRGPLPDAATRARMVQHMITEIPGFADLESMPWYPGKTFDGYVRL
ncbi:aldo/keto reductase [Plantactinospora sp. CA-294935]|uniref:aldo/keto reductase n=1 Tax=Plantactinospora sp. CA-294935 TaxID=3240012 RepID=UPI003D8DE56A